MLMLTAECRQSLDLHQTAYHYLYTSLMKIKSIANHPNLPDVVRREMPKPKLEDREQAALHHVTSCLFNRLEVRQVMDKVINEVCRVLKVPPPEKKKGKKKGGKDDGGAEPGSRDQDKAAVDGEDDKKVAKTERKENGEKSGDEQKKAKQTPREEETGTEGEEAPRDEMDTDEEERAFSKYESLLAGSSEESDADSESESDHIQKGKRRSIRVRDMSISLSPEPESASASPSVSASDVGSQSEQSEPEAESESEPDEPPPKQIKLSEAKRAKSPDQTFLPTLMGGYISGSESASDVDVAPRKNRLGQKQRRAIWEKKFGSQAKHLQKQQQEKRKRKGTVRGDGWDLQRGAVDDEGGGRKPWKKGIEGPLSIMKKEAAPEAAPEGKDEKEKKKKPKKDNEGPLHPSWEAKKRAKEKEQQQPRKIDVRPTGENKIVFDD